MDPADITSGLAVALRKARQARGLTIREAQKRSGVASLSRVESGEHNLNMGVILRLARCYGVSASHLVLCAENFAEGQVVL